MKLIDSIHINRNEYFPNTVTYLNDHIKIFVFIHEII